MFTYLHKVEHKSNLIFGLYVINVSKHILNNFKQSNSYNSLININFYAYRINAKYHNITEKSTKQLS